jgi:hypothetical protein
LCCSGSNRRLIVVPLSFPNLRRLRKHRASSTSIVLTVCPLFIGLTPCPLHFLSRLCVLYLPWVDSVSPTFLESTACRLPLLVPTSRQLPLILSTIPSGHEYYQSLEHLRSLEYHATSNSVSTIPPRIDYCSVYSLCVDYSFVSTTSPLVDVNYSLYQHLLEYSVLFKISSMSGLWTADTWAMSADAQLCDSGQWTPRDRRWQFWPCIPEV